ncbi:MULTISPECIES: Uma2 family endonuclease [unclassified Streptomyces]|uniref:Uma2 family endonuclease n=1 Tax=unclassified Streptomyces TaxID=2593676 RepID=UPI00225AC5B3|nr:MULTISPECIES: Uma2 family endonuclease [unclassified Streptomyces]WSP60038.1 Uma2 family endonuclease [Streptomyces sp. NBC_01241]WSU26554.1 Uma2 family endonuclease [Streptomyces sp. NBC_01108]MCX4787233.1 Uma2 family endonuclease [Streptomyces sp. NBC_01221]MCX4796984.1 Uma2 family endonuclease [Streptomyces sp. NBC_01242]WSJ41141.1 Uma2 family endonuclease [Streptomyces sp. NBC_01321]
MTAEPIAGHSSRWPVPPQDGYTVDDLFTLPDLPPHTELIDGSLVFVSPQRRFHAKMIDLLMNGLRGTIPGSLKAEREMTVVLDRRNGPEPDVSVVRADAATDLEQTRFQAADVLLAVEVVSPDSEARDRDAKPQKYAAAGIPNFWLVEMAGTDRHPVVRVYELDPVSKTYALTGIHHDRLKTGVPFPIDIDITLDALKQL